jgi:hypothetical protein
MVSISNNVTHRMGYDLNRSNYIEIRLRKASLWVYLRVSFYSYFKTLEGYLI